MFSFRKNFSSELSRSKSENYFRVCFSERFCVYYIQEKYIELFYNTFLLHLL